MLMRTIVSKAQRELTRATIYLAALSYGSKNAEAFKDVERYCMFLGYPRSGHSLIGALLDAHPNAIIAHEQDALKYIQAGYTRPRLYNILLANSRMFARGGRKWREFLYHVPNQWQGRFKKLRVIGDKKGGKSTRRLRADPGLLEVLKNTLNEEIKFIHMVRNPYDNISTISRKHGFPLRKSIDFYFSLCETVSGIKRDVGAEAVLDIAHESFIEEPRTNLARICGFLGLDAPPEYLDDCSSIVYRSPHKSRQDIQWSPGNIRLVKDRMGDFPFLNGYSYES